MADNLICSIPGCYKKTEAKGLCSAHYTRLRRHGDPLAGRTVVGEPAKFLQEVVLKFRGNDCLQWPYGRDRKGYGLIYIDGHHCIASRIVCEAVEGPPPTDRHQAAHSCGNGHLGCVNPNHLSWKTPADNQADRLAHDTHNRGERHGISKLTEADVRTIRRLKGSIPQRKIASIFGVCQMQISNIHSGKAWGWL